MRVLCVECGPLTVLHDSAAPWRLARALCPLSSLTEHFSGLPCPLQDLPGQGLRHHVYPQSPVTSDSSSPLAPPGSPVTHVVCSHHEHCLGHRGEGIKLQIHAVTNESKNFMLNERKQRHIIYDNTKESYCHNL